MVNPFDGQEVWFLTGSQHLYGEETLQQVAEQSQRVASALDTADEVPVRVVWKPVLTDAAAIRRAMGEANEDARCLGVITWMHTFSPAKMWLTGLDALRKPLLHLHTQADAALPWATIDMDFMNLNQAAHGDREYGFVLTRLRVPRTTVAGHADNPRVRARIGSWARAAAGAAAARDLRVARFGDNMRNVAVTEGDKVEAEIRFGMSVNTWGVNDLVAAVDAVGDKAVDALVEEYGDLYEMDAAVAPRRGEARGRALPGPHRGGAARIPGRRRLRRLHHQLRGPRRPAPAARPGRTTADGRRLRIRRRGRLEDRGAAAGAQGRRRRAGRGHVLHGGLHLRPGVGHPEDPGGAHARGVSDHHRRTAAGGGSPPVDRRTRGPGPPGVHRRTRRRRGDRLVRPGRPLPVGGERDRRRRTRRAASEPARRPRGLAAAPELRGRHRGLADRGRPAPHGAHHRPGRRGARPTSPRSSAPSSCSSTPRPPAAACSRSCGGAPPTTGWPSGYDRLRPVPRCGTRCSGATSRSPMPAWPP